MSLTNPLVIFLGVWSLSFLLFSLHLSELLLNSPADLVALFVVITVPFVCGYLLVSSAHSRLQAGSQSATEIRRDFAFKLERRIPAIRRKLQVFFCIWCAISVVEIIASKGLPILWLFTGAGLTYGDFGIPSLHGLTNSLLLASSLVSFALYLQTRRRSYLIIPIASIVWSIVVISRNLLLVDVLQIFILWLRFHALNIRRTVIRSLAFGLAILYVFGMVGDMRTGAHNFLNVAEPTVTLPAWVPSGFFWAYMYTTTPLNNMVFNVRNVNPVDTGSLANTVPLLLPSVVRKAVFPDIGDTSDDLLSSAFNVSSAFIGPYQDEGLPGIFVYSALLGLVGTIFWYKRSLIGYLGYCVLGQCLFFSNFYNHFLYLPIVFQFFWFYVYRTNLLPRTHS